MYICLCNPFTEQDLDHTLMRDDVPKKASKVYQACAGGEKPCCGSCLCEIRDRLNQHKAG